MSSRLFMNALHIQRIGLLSLRFYLEDRGGRLHNHTNVRTKARDPRGACDEIVPSLRVTGKYLASTDGRAQSGSGQPARAQSPTFVRVLVPLARARAPRLLR
eukprot:scaffold4464_cov40-Prasinocladus_malaysianus.AAC.1